MFTTPHASCTDADIEVDTTDKEEWVDSYGRTSGVFRTVWGLGPEDVIGGPAARESAAAKGEEG